MSLNMQGHIDSVFKSTDATRITKSGGSYVDGVWIPAPETRGSYVVNVQPLSEREIYFLNIGAERIASTQKLYINSGDLNAITLDDDWEFYGQKWKCTRLDNRPHRNYCKVIVERYDDQS